LDEIIKGISYKINNLGDIKKELESIKINNEVNFAINHEFMDKTVKEIKGYKGTKRSE